MDKDFDYFMDRATQWYLASGRGAMDDVTPAEQNAVLKHLYNRLEAMSIAYHEFAILLDQPAFDSNALLGEFVGRLGNAMCRLYYTCALLKVTPALSGISKTLSFMGRLQAKHANSYHEIGNFLLDTWIITEQSIEGFGNELELGYIADTGDISPRLSGLIECCLVLSQSVGINFYSLFNIYHHAEMTALVGELKPVDIKPLLRGSYLVKEPSLGPA